MWWAFALDFILLPLSLNVDVIIDLPLYDCICLKLYHQSVTQHFGTNCVSEIQNLFK